MEDFSDLYFLQNFGGILFYMYFLSCENGIFNLFYLDFFLNWCRRCFSKYYMIRRELNSKGIMNYFKNIVV